MLLITKIKFHKKLYLEIKVSIWFIIRLSSLF